MKNEETRNEVAKNTDYSSIFDIKQNLEGVQLRLPQIGIIHQGQMFKMPDGSKEASIKGVILDVSRANAFWKTDFTGNSGDSPDCYSLDGNVPVLSEAQESDKCINCAQNQFGSATKGGGKACKNMKRIHLLMEGNLLPYRLTVPPSNLVAVDTYLTNVASLALPYQMVTTIFNLSEVSNKDGIAFSMLQLMIDPESIKKEGTQTLPTMTVDKGFEIKSLRDKWLSAMRGQIVTDEER